MTSLTTALLLFLVFVAFTVEADAGSFNLSGSFDPGITIGRGHHTRRHRSHARNDETSDDTQTTDFTNPDEIHNFEVPEVFTHDANEDGGNKEQPTRHHDGSHHRSRRH